MKMNKLLKFLLSTVTAFAIVLTTVGVLPLKQFDNGDSSFVIQSSATESWYLSDADALKFLGFLENDKNITASEAYEKNYLDLLTGRITDYGTRASTAYGFLSYAYNQTNFYITKSGKSLDVLRAGILDSFEDKLPDEKKI